MYRRTFLASALVSALAGAAAFPVRAMGAAFFNRNGLAMDGFDTVSFFSDRGPVRGRRDIAVTWKGAAWQFASVHSRDRFEADPWSFAPRYGGYCAYSLAMGRLSPGSPRSWRIDGGRLYLMVNDRVKDMWDSDKAEFLVRADANWPAILSGL